jgi:hypothetical protein
VLTTDFSITELTVVPEQNGDILESGTNTASSSSGGSGDSQTLAAVTITFGVVAVVISVGVFFVVRRKVTQSPNSRRVFYATDASFHLFAACDSCNSSPSRSDSHAQIHPPTCLFDSVM